MQNETKPVVFIVEDNETYAEMIRFQLQKHNYQTFTYHTGEDCVRNLYKIPDIIVLDFMLGNMDGLEVLKQVKSINPDIQVVFLSGQDDINVGVNSLKYGAYDYVLKDENAFDNLLVALQKISRLQRMVHRNVRKTKLTKTLIAAAVFTIGLLLFNMLF